MVLMDRVTIDPEVCGGAPCVRGLRIPVSVVLKPDDIPACLWADFIDSIA